MQTCPKCQYVRKPTDTNPEWQCPNCGIAYAKFGTIPHGHAHNLDPGLPIDRVSSLAPQHESTYPHLNPQGADFSRGCPVADDSIPDRVEMPRDMQVKRKNPAWMELFKLPAFIHLLAVGMSLFGLVLAYMMWESGEQGVMIFLYLPLFLGGSIELVFFVGNIPVFLGKLLFPKALMVETRPDAGHVANAPTLAYPIGNPSVRSSNFDSAFAAGENSPVQGRIPRKMRLDRDLWVLIPLIYGTYIAIVDDVIFPASSVELPDWVCWIIYAAIICGVLVLLSVVIGYRDDRAEKRYYNIFGIVFQTLAWSSLVVALVGQLSLKSDHSQITPDQDKSCTAITNVSYDTLRSPEAWETLNAKWEQKWQEQQNRGYTTGTIDEYFKESHHVNVICRLPRTVVFTSSKYPGIFYSLYQTQSVQGNSILLGPVSMPNMKNVTPAQYLRMFRVDEPTVKFDEDKHYSNPYTDNLNYSAMFVIYEKSGQGKELDVPIQALFYPRHLKSLNLVDKKTNDGLYWRGIFISLIPFIISSMLGLEDTMPIILPPTSRR